MTGQMRLQEALIPVHRDAAPPNLSLLGVYDWVYGGLDVHFRMRGSVYDQAGPKSFDLPGRPLRGTRSTRTSPTRTVEFPSPCDGSDSARRSVFRGLVRVRTSGPR